MARNVQELKRVSLSRRIRVQKRASERSLATLGWIRKFDSHKRAVRPF